MKILKSFSIIVINLGNNFTYTASNINLDEYILSYLNGNFGR